jgi:hypothetical protein
MSFAFEFQYFSKKKKKLPKQDRLLCQFFYADRIPVRDQAWEKNSPWQRTGTGQFQGLEVGSTKDQH